MRKKFAELLTREILAEIQYCADVSAGRAQRRQTYNEKLLAFVIKSITVSLSIAGAAFPPAGLITAAAAPAIELLGKGIQAKLGSEEEKKYTELNITLNNLMQLIELYLSQFAKLASLRYAYLLEEILDSSSEAPLIVFSQIGARRILDYLKRQADITSIQGSPDSLFKCLLDGLIQGHSGKQGIFSSDHFIISKKGEKLSVEELFCRAAMRRVCIQDQYDEDIYYRLKSFHTEKNIDKDFKWGSVKLLGKGKEINDRINAGPKYGFMYVGADSISDYDYKEKFPAIVSQVFRYSPSVYIASKNEVMSYQDLVKKEIVADKPITNFFNYISIKAKAAHDKRVIDEVWVRDADFSGQQISCGDYSKIDFSGCKFNNTIIKGDAKSGHPVRFDEAIMMFIEAKSVICEEVYFTKADFSGANLSKASFTNVRTEGIKLLSAEIKDIIIATTDSPTQSKVEELMRIQKEQMEAAAKLREELISKLNKVSQDLEEAEQKMLIRHAQLVKDLEPLKASNSQMSNLLEETSCRILYLENEVKEQRSWIQKEYELLEYKKADATSIIKLNKLIESLDEKLINYQKEYEVLRMETTNSNEIAKELIKLQKELAEMKIEQEKQTTKRIQELIENRICELTAQIQELQKKIAAIPERIQPTARFARELSEQARAEVGPINDTGQSFIFEGPSGHAQAAYLSQQGFFNRGSSGTPGLPYFDKVKGNAVLKIDSVTSIGSQYTFRTQDNTQEESEREKEKNSLL